MNNVSQRPNIVYIVADDLGYADLGCYGGREPVSPVIDRLAANGLRLTQGYANSPVCSPTRFALITGRYPYRFVGAADEPISGASRGSATLGLPPQHPTLPSLLREAGYRTALIGKWHLGFPPHFGPLKSGYDEFFGPLSGGVDYFSHCDSRGQHDLWHGDASCLEQGYLTDLLSQRAAQWIRSTRQPFFLSLHYTAPHWPWETRADADLAESVRERLAHTDGGSVATYRRMIFEMDEGIGAVMRAIEDIGALHHTLVVFTSDNGGERYSDNWPLVGGKMDLTEGGIRVPWVAHWPAVIAPGGKSRQHCMTMDWTATMLQAAGAQADPDHPLDGVSLLPLLADADHSFDRPMFWRMTHRQQRAHRHGRWKYLSVDQHSYLFDLESDERERANLALRMPQQVAALSEAWHAWNESMPAIPADARVALAYTTADMPQR